jgi:hypothetical protein
MLPRVSSRVSGFPRVSMGEAALKLLLFEGVKAGCHVVLRGRRGTLSHSNLSDTVSTVSKVGEVSHEMLLLLCPRVSSRVSGFLWPRHVYGGSCKTFPFRRFPSRLSSFCVAGAALRDIPICLMTCRNWFCVAGSKLLLRFHKMSCTSRGRRSILEISVIIYVASAALQTCRIACSTLHTLYSTLYTSHSTLYSAFHTLHFTLHTLHSTLYTLHSTLDTSHPTLHTLHSTLYIPHSTQYTPHSTLYM